MQQRGDVFGSRPIELVVADDDLLVARVVLGDECGERLVLFGRAVEDDALASLIDDNGRTAGNGLILGERIAAGDLLLTPAQAKAGALIGRRELDGRAQSALLGEQRDRARR